MSLRQTETPRLQKCLLTDNKCLHLTINEGGAVRCDLRLYEYNASCPLSVKLFSELIMQSYSESHSNFVLFS